jgi:elongation factor P hydroxylase
VFFREDFGRSALHEVAHWCVAGAIRRRLPDYGYWYAPDGRDEREQAAFFSVEVTPQAIEALFCESLGLAFTVSVDNLMISSDDPAIQVFNEAVTTKVSLLRLNGLPPRASRFNQALAVLSLSV